MCSSLVLTGYRNRIDPESGKRKGIANIADTKVDVHCMNELKGRSIGYLFAIYSRGYVSPGSDPAAASG
jgi:hypothetical protein